ncbi:MAG TPA: sigma 54-interacting transcriptional regulator, partial [Polyangiaceae bacterium]
LLAQSAGGTLLLDEIGELDAPLQRALTRALLARPAPGTSSAPAARVLVASRKNLDLLVQQGRFREDLYAQVSAARIELPPLRAREGDVELLARQFWLEGGGEARTFPADMIARSAAHPWPGNVRELRELVSKLLVPGADATVQAPAPAPDPAASDSVKLAAIVEQLLEADVSYSEARRRLLVEFEQRYVERMLAAHRGNITRAAAASGLARRNFQLIRARRREEGT